ncbi:MAG: type II secretion system protein GspN [Bradymonadaceae bacterium]
MEFLENKAVRSVIYAVFGLVMFMVFVIATFPDKRVREIIVVQLEQSLDNRYDVKIADMGLWRVSGIQLRGVSISERVLAVEEDAEEEEEFEGPPGDLPMNLNIEKISARLAPLASAFHRGPTVNFQVDIGGGSVFYGSFRQNRAGQRVSLELDDLDLRRSPLLASLIGMPVFGVLDGEVVLEFEANRPVVKGGHIDLVGKQLTVGPKVIQTDKLPLITELNVPVTNFGNVVMRMNIEEGEGKAASPRLVIEEFKTRGRDIHTEIWGEVALANQLGTSRPQLELRMQVNEEYVTSNNLGMVFNLAEFRNGKNNEWYGFVLVGNFQNLNFRGSRTAAQGPRDTAGQRGADES